MEKSVPWPYKVAMSETPNGLNLAEALYKEAAKPLIEKHFPDLAYAAALIGPGSSQPRNLVNADGTLYFNASDATGGVGIYTSDGTQQGTQLVKDGWGSDAAPTGFTSFNGSVYFTASLLWKTDGSAAGTGQLTPPRP